MKEFSWYGTFSFKAGTVPVNVEWVGYPTGRNIGKTNRDKKYKSFQTNMSYFYYFFLNKSEDDETEGEGKWLSQGSMATE